MNYTVYKITNLINEKYYIGTHKTKDPIDSYMGSGIGIKAAIEKYGKENFKKEILFIFDNSEDMYSKEKELVDKNDNMSYNAKDGGFGGWDHIDSSGENNPNYGNRWTMDEEIKAKVVRIGEENGMYGKTHSKESRKIMSEKQKRPFSEKMDEETAKRTKEAISNAFKDKPKTEEQKRKMSESAKERWKNIPIVECPHCGKTGKQPQMKQWHFANCKLIKD